VAAIAIRVGRSSGRSSSGTTTSAPTRCRPRTRSTATPWGPKYVDETHYLRQYMAQLRRKLEPDPPRPRHLLTELGMGYRYQP
jgi:DNA-binding response OmpR family regulator